jgi:hypothetical protein
MPFTVLQVCIDNAPGNPSWFVRKGIAVLTPIHLVGFNAAATYEDLRNGECTSCAVTEDMSSYWAPNLYFRHANGSYEEVQQVGGMLA